MLFQVKIFNKNGGLVRIISKEEVIKQFWRARKIDRIRTKGAAVPGYGRIDYRDKEQPKND